jgi:hypothetical protein
MTMIVSEAAAITILPVDYDEKQIAEAVRIAAQKVIEKIRSVGSVPTGDIRVSVLHQPEIDGLSIADLFPDETPNAVRVSIKCDPVDVEES